MSERSKITKTSLRLGQPPDKPRSQYAQPDLLDNLDLAEDVETILFDVSHEQPHQQLERPRNPAIEA